MTDPLMPPLAEGGPAAAAGGAAERTAGVRHAATTKIKACHRTGT